MSESSAIESIRNKLQLLHDGLKASDLPIDTEAVARELVESLRTDVRPHEAPLVASLTLSSSVSILRFLTQAVRVGTVERATTLGARGVLLGYLMRLVGEPLSAARPLVAEHVAAIREVCIDVYRREELTKHRGMALAAAAGVVRLREPALSAEQLGVRDMANYLLRDLTGSKSKLSATLRAQIFRTLGLFAERFPERMFDKATQLRQLFIDVLSGRSSVAKTERSLVAGTLDGLCSLLVHFSGDFSADESNVRSLYKFVSVALTHDATSSRYDIPRAALRLVARHAALLQRYLTEDGEKAFERLTYWCCHINSLMRKAAFIALDAFYTIVAAELVSSARHESANRASFRFFVGSFIRTLEQRSASVHAVSTAICGLGRFAAPIAKFGAPHELNSLLDRLLTHGMQHYSGDPAQLDDTLQHMPALLTALSNVILALGNVPLAAMQRLEMAFGTAFVVFRHAHPHHQPRHCRALSRLLCAIATSPSALNLFVSKVKMKFVVVFEGSPSQRELFDLI